jgi:hypothetical protein
VRRCCSLALHLTILRMKMIASGEVQCMACELRIVLFTCNGSGGYTVQRHGGARACAIQMEFDQHMRGVSISPGVTVAASASAADDARRKTAAQLSAVLYRCSLLSVRCKKHRPSKLPLLQHSHFLLHRPFHAPLS